MIYGNLLTESKTDLLEENIEKDFINNAFLFLDEEVLYEFDGNKSKVAEFKNICDTAGNFFKTYYNIIIEESKAADEIVDNIEKASKAKKGTNIGKYLLNVKKISDNIIDMVKKSNNSAVTNNTEIAKNIKRSLKSFTVKYSELTMEEKKSFSEKLKKYMTFSSNIVSKYDNTNKKLNKRIDDIRNNSTLNSHNSEIGPFFTIMIDAINAVADNAYTSNAEASYIYYYINNDIDKSNKSIIYKVLNKHKNNFKGK